MPRELGRTDLTSWMVSAPWPPRSEPDRRPEGLVFRPSAITTDNLSFRSTRITRAILMERATARGFFFFFLKKPMRRSPLRSRLRPVDREWPFADAYHIISEQKAKVSERGKRREEG